MRVSARHAVESDSHELVELAARGLEEKLSQRGGRLWSILDIAHQAPAEVIAEAITSPSKLAAVGQIDGAAVGLAMATILEPSGDTPPIVELIAIHVDESARGVGVGEALMDLVLQWASEHECGGIDSTALPGDRNTKNFFESFGLVARAIRVHRAL